ncbi:MAG: hypothetical protein EAY75_15875 [Bacteroidetes bacterium]|nr:MAG: hypothetical protein EAY75_15875 [Bacteroidota bacterium]
MYSWRAKIANSAKQRRHHFNPAMHRAAPLPKPPPSIANPAPKNHPPSGFGLFPSIPPARRSPYLVDGQNQPLNHLKKEHTARACPQAVAPTSTHRCAVPTRMRTPSPMRKCPSTGAHTSTKHPSAYHSHALRHAYNHKKTNT